MTENMKNFVFFQKTFDFMFDFQVALRYNAWNTTWFCRTHMRTVGTNGLMSCSKNPFWSKIGLFRSEMSKFHNVDQFLGLLIHSRIPINPLRPSHFSKMRKNFEPEIQLENVVKTAKMGV